MVRPLLLVLTLLVCFSAYTWEDTKAYLHTASVAQHHREQAEHQAASLKQARQFKELFGFPKPSSTTECIAFQGRFNRRIEQLLEKAEKEQQEFAANPTSLNSQNMEASIIRARSSVYEASRQCGFRTPNDYRWRLKGLTGKWEENLYETY